MRDRQGARKAVVAMQANDTRTFEQSVVSKMHDKKNLENTIKNPTVTDRQQIHTCTQNNYRSPAAHASGVNEDTSFN